MIDVNWDLAPEGAVELKYSKSDCSASWFNNKGEHWFEDCWMNVTFPDDWQTIATRPTQTKTVADAVEYYNGVWPEKVSKLHYMSWDSNKGIYSFAGCESTRNVCTRAEFEAYVKEQEGEKWTHLYNEHEVCRVLIENPDRFGIIVIDTAGNGYITCAPDEIKPIKPNRFSVKNGFVYDGDVRMVNSDVVNVLNYMVDKLDR